MARTANPHKEKLLEIAAERKIHLKAVKAAASAEKKIEKLDALEAKLKGGTATTKKVDAKPAKKVSKTVEKVVKKNKASKPEEKKRGRPAKKAEPIMAKKSKKRKVVDDDDDDE